MKLSRFAFFFATIFCLTGQAHAQDAQSNRPPQEIPAAEPQSAKAQRELCADCNGAGFDRRLQPDQIPGAPGGLLASNAPRSRMPAAAAKKAHGQNLRAMPTDAAQPAYIVVDRLTDAFAVLDADGVTFAVPRHVLPDGACAEGAVLQWQHVPQIQSQRRQEAINRIERLRNMSETMHNI